MIKELMYSVINNFIILIGLLAMFFLILAATACIGGYPSPNQYISGKEVVEVETVGSRVVGSEAVEVEPIEFDTVERWRGLVVTDENRCSPYSSKDYRYSQSVEQRIVDAQGGIFSPYTGVWFDSTKETDIEHIVARSEAHDSGLCAASVATRKAFSSDPLNLTLASPSLNRWQKRDKDATNWQPKESRCWFAETVVEVRQAYGLTIDAQERDALEKILTTECFC